MLKRYCRYYILVLVFLSPLLTFCFSIKGKYTGLDSCYYPKVYLAVINDIKHINSISSDFVIAEAIIMADGSFSLEGDFLSDDTRFYRLYVTKEENNNAFLSMGKHENYVLLALKNSSKISVNCSNICEVFPLFNLSGVIEAHYLSILSEIDREWVKSIIKDSITPQKKELLIDKVNRDRIRFADTSQLIIPALLAILNTNIAEKFKENEAFYTGFLKRMQKEIPNSPYTKQYEKLILKISKQHTPNTTKTNNSLLWLVVVLAIVLVGSVGFNLYLFTKQKQLSKTADIDLDYHALLTIKEKQIVVLIDEGLSNKEIAEKLNIELSTVKSHVSHIFQKSNISNRNQISKIALKLR